MSISWLTTANGHSTLLRGQTCFLNELSSHHPRWPLYSSPSVLKLHLQLLFNWWSHLRHHWEKTPPWEWNFLIFTSPNLQPYLTLLHLRPPLLHALWAPSPFCFVSSVLSKAAFLSAPGQLQYLIVGSTGRFSYLFAWHATPKFNSLNNSHIITQECGQGSERGGLCLFHMISAGTTQLRLGVLITCLTLQLGTFSQLGLGWASLSHGLSHVLRP